MCSGNENSLQQCRHEGVGDHDCEHSNDAGVACIEFNGIEEPSLYAVFP